MKKLFGAVIAFSALSCVAVAQPAYSPEEGDAPSSYPSCTHPHEDRCVQRGPMTHHGGHHHHHHD
jgi:hypothetical protein